jgi:parallel beta-helix repeat protein
MNKTEKKKIFGRVILIAMITLMFMVVSPMTASAADPCNYSICLKDSYGDGWNGGTVDLSVNGVLIHDDLTLAGGPGPECHNFSVNTTDEITTDYIASGWPDENEYYIEDEDGYVVRYEGAGGAIPGDIGAGELYADCNPPPPDLVITEKTEEWVNESHFNVNYTVCNIGNGNANASNTTIYIDSVNVSEVPAPALAPSACNTSTVGPFECPCGSTLNITVCADNLDEVDESNETNNCLTNMLPCNEPDLTISTKTEEWVNETHFNINYTVCNIGNATANASNTTIYIDGVNSLEDPVPALAPSACDTDTVGPFGATSGSIINVTVCADNLDQVDESDETNNCRTNIFGCGNLPCNCGDICVNPSGWWCNNGEFNTSSTPIQDAVNNASVCCGTFTCADPCEICVKDGAYTENVVVDTANLTIRSENGPDVTTVDGTGGDVFWVGKLSLVAINCVTITGFTVTGATGGSMAGIHLGDWNTAANHCNISYNKASGNYHGIYVEKGEYNDIIGNTVNNNADDGIYVKGDHNNIKDNSNTVNYNGEDGIQLYQANYCNVTGNIANENSAYGINLYSATYNTIKDNVVNENVIGGIYLGGTSSDFNKLSDNTANENEKYGIYLYYADQNNITSMSAGNVVRNNGKYGFFLWGADDNEITCNWVADNDEKGFYLRGHATGNNISYNNIITNGVDQGDGSYQWNFHNYQSDTVDADDNYWGTNIEANITASIKEEGGTVDYTPFATGEVPCAPIPELATIVLLATGLLALMGYVGYRRRK